MTQNAQQYLERLVSFATISEDSNLPLIEYVESVFGAQGIETHRLPTPDGQKAGLIAQTGPNVAGGIALSAHSDVVPTKGQAWNSDPFVIRVQDGRFYGRGTCDMKGFVALAMDAMVKAQKMNLARPLQFALSRDEEIGLRGAQDVAQGLLDHFPKAAAVIVGEPTQMQVVTGHKSCDDIQVQVRGYEVHSSRLFEGVSAVMTAARMVEWLRVQNTENMNKHPTAIAALYDPPFSTLHVGQIQGGTAINITAKECHFTVDLRCVGDEISEDWFAKFRQYADRLQAEMQAIAPQSGIDMTLNVGPSLAPEKNGFAETLARRISGDNGTHTVAYGTDGGHFQRLGFSTVVCGPGSIAQAHQPNEYLEISQFEAGAAFLDKLLIELQA